MRKTSRFIALLLSVVMVLGMIPTAFATEETPEYDVNLALISRGVIATSSTPLNDYTADKAVDGVYTIGQFDGWTTAIGKTQWIMLDMGKAVTFNRWVVRNDGFSRATEGARNTRACQLQYWTGEGKPTGSETAGWTDADAVTNNTANVIDRTLSEDCTAQYIRLYITEPNQASDDNLINNPRGAVIAFELYNMSEGSGSEDEPENPNVALNATVFACGSYNGDSTYRCDHIVDGAYTPNFWCCNCGGNNVNAVHWAILDLGTAKEMNFFRLVNSGVLAGQAAHNTPGFEIQYLEDTDDMTQEELKAAQWKTAAAVTGNTETYVSKYFNSTVTARYVRLYITRADNSNGHARIFELELSMKQGEITSPEPYKIFQRDDSGVVDMTVTGNVSNTVTAATAVLLNEQGAEAYKAEMAIQNGTASVVLNDVATGMYTLQMRNADNEVIDTVEEVGVGDLWLVAGQSNAAGNGMYVSGEAVDSADDDPAMKGVHCYTRKESFWQLASHPAVGPEGKHSPSLAFAKTIKENTGVPIGLICVAVGGSAISAWQTNGNNFNHVKNACAALGTDITGVFWYQGEANTFSTNDATVKAYADSFKTLVTTWRAYFNNDDLPFITAQLNNWTTPYEGAATNGWWYKVKEQQRQVADPNNDLYIDGVAVIATTGLPMGDMIHNSANSNVIIGKRMAQAALALAYGKDVAYGQPNITAANAEGTTLTLTFENVGTGLKASGDITDFTVRDNRGTVAISKAEISGTNQVVLTLDRALENNPVVDALASTTAVPTVLNNLDEPILAFYEYPVSVAGRVEAHNIALNKEFHVCGAINGTYHGDKLVDGNCVYPNMWCCTNNSHAGTHWAIIDLGAEHTLTGFKLWNTGTAGGTKYNTSDFELQYLESTEEMDATALQSAEWKTITTYVDNAANEVEATFEAVTARYVRLYVTGASQNPNSGDQQDTYTRIPELELYGHQNETVAGKEATCLEPGLTDGVKCSVCYEILTEQEEIEKLEHSYTGEGGVCVNGCGEKVTAQIGEEIFRSIAEALDAAKDGDTVKVVANSVETYLMVKPGVTLDLNGCTVEADYIAACFGGAVVMDGSAEKTGVLKGEYVKLDSGNPQLPVLTEEGYVFASISDTQESLKRENENQAEYKWWTVTDLDKYLEENGGEASGLCAVIEVAWGNQKMKFTFTDDEMFKQVFGGGSFLLKVTGVKGLEGVVFTGKIISETGVVLECAGLNLDNV